MGEANGGSTVVSGLRPPWKRGQSGNPTGAGGGRPCKADAIAKAYAKQVGLEFLIELATKLKARHAEIADALLDAAAKPNMTGVVAVQVVARMVGLIEDKQPTVTVEEMRRAFQVVWELIAEEVGYEKAQRIADAWADRVSGIKGGQLSLLAEPEAEADREP